MNIILTVVVVLLTIICVFLATKLITLYNDVKKINTFLQELKEEDLNRRISIKSTDNNSNLLGLLLNRFLEDWMKTVERANRSEHIRKQMVANISHDLRTPLTSILGYLEALQFDDDLSQEEKNKYLDIISNRGKSLLVLINEFFELVRLEAEEELDNLQPLKLNELVKEEVLQQYYLFNDAGIEPEIILTKDDVYICGDEKGVRRIITNLLSNALRYGLDGKEIGIEVIKENEEIRLTVWDRGKGIPEKNMKYIFDRLYTGEHSRSTILQGTGLGLTIVKTLVDKHHGRIHVESEPFVRTAFSCYFPITNPERKSSSIER